MAVEDEVGVRMMEGGAIPTQANLITALSLEVCKRNGWDRGWLHVGCYLHLEVSEYIEALRGKNTALNATLSEAGDILFVLASSLGANGQSLQQAMDSIQRKMERMLESYSEWQ